jgi:hypothetical protein
MNNVGIEVEGVVADGEVSGDVPRPDFAAHGRPEEAERQVRLERAEPGRRQRIAGGGIAHHAHRVAAPGLLGGEVAHVAEEAADGRAQDVQDAIASAGAGADAARLRASARRRRAYRRA